jgi:hypothetical protein
MTDERIHELWALVMKSSDWPIYRRFARLIEAEVAKPLVEALRDARACYPVDYHVRITEILDAGLADYERRAGGKESDPPCPMCAELSGLPQPPEVPPMFRQALRGLVPPEILEMVKPACPTCGGAKWVRKEFEAAISGTMGTVNSPYNTPCPDCAGGKKE